MADRQEAKLRPYLSPAGALAFSLGTSIGWGSLVVTCNSYLAEAGPMGSVLGLIVGAIIMLVISRNNAYLMNCCPESGGAYAYARDRFGYDHGFLTAWFLGLTYLAVLWANATSLPLFARYFLGGVFHVGRLYTIFGYEVYLGEALLSIAGLLLTMLLCMRGRNLISSMMVALAVVFSLGIAVCFFVSILHLKEPITPVFIPDKSTLSQIVRIACISPWAFIGFENISHFSEEFSFRQSRAFRILVTSVVITTLLYVFVMLLSITAYPPEYSSWLEYIRDIGNLDGIKGLPAFYAANVFLGRTGVSILIAALFALIVSSLIGNTMALSRLFYALARDGILPARYAELNNRGNPAKAIMLIAGISMIVPFLGRTAISWIVDVTTLGATLVYGFVSASAMKLADAQNDRLEKATGTAGLILMIAFAAYVLLPNLFTEATMATPSYFLFVLWSVLGFVYFRLVLGKDQKRRFGKSIIVWIALLSLILFVSLVWMSQSTMDATGRAMEHMQEFYAEAGFPMDQSEIIAGELNAIRQTNARSILVVVGVFALSLGVMLNNYTLMSRRVQESEQQLGLARAIANSDPLTGVKSKHAYLEKEKNINEQLTAGEAGAFAIVVCDLNGLKYINDTQGHKAGDEYIKAASVMICEYFQHSPVYRMGGDEFVVILTGRDYENRRQIMEELHLRSVEHIGSDNVVISAGLADYSPETDHSVRSVFDRADARMYQEKRALKSLGARTR